MLSTVARFSFRIYELPILHASNFVVSVGEVCPLGVCHPFPEVRDVIQDSHATASSKAAISQPPAPFKMPSAQLDRKRQDKRQPASVRQDVCASTAAPAASRLADIHILPPVRPAWPGICHKRDAGSSSARPRLRHV